MVFLRFNCGGVVILSIGLWSVISLRVLDYKSNYKYNWFKFVSWKLSNLVDSEFIESQLVFLKASNSSFSLSDSVLVSKS